MLQKTLILAAVGIIGLAGAAEARDQIRIVGSSTVFPFSTATYATTHYMSSVCIGSFITSDS